MAPEYSSSFYPNSYARQNVWDTEFLEQIFLTIVQYISVIMCPTYQSCTRMKACLVTSVSLQNKVMHIISVLLVKCKIHFSLLPTHHLRRKHSKTHWNQVLLAYFRIAIVTRFRKEVTENQKSWNWVKNKSLQIKNIFWDEAKQN